MSEKAPIPSPIVADEATWKILEDRIHTQQHRVYNALGVVQLAAQQVHELSDGENSREIAPIVCALTLVEETLADIAERLEAPEILNGWPAKVSSAT
jgi:hypothetical protein